MAAVTFNADHFPEDLLGGDWRIWGGAGIALEGDLERRLTYLDTDYSVSNDSISSTV
jgi:hypothetical protein